MSLPIIDVGPLLTEDLNAKKSVASQINRACREVGFFYVTQHGVSSTLVHSLQGLSALFFSLPESEKETISMAKGGRAWRGYFRVGAELTSGRPDQKEGLYFGQQLDESHPLVQAKTPLHGPNLFPENPADLATTVLQYMAAMTRLGHQLMSGIALALGLEQDYFERHGTTDPLTLFRIFNYPPCKKAELWGVGEHTDYGLLTILLQDDVGGLEVKTADGWISAPPVPDTFVCNIGDMLDRMTRGLYRSTPHRVKNSSTQNRLSFPFFFDPNFFSKVKPIELAGIAEAADDSHARWDKANVHLFEGTYGDYLLNKVGKVFPQLRSEVL